MDIDIIEDKKNKLIFEIDEDEGLLKAVQSELNNDPDVKAAGVYVDHVLVGKKRFILETSAKKEAKKAFKEAVSRLQRYNKDFAKIVSGIKH